MSIITKHLKYLKENPEGYWFRRKLYGWGWTPASWQGWATLALYVGILVFILTRADSVTSQEEVLSDIVFPSIALSALLIAICYKTGEKPKWQWGVEK